MYNFFKTIFRILFTLFYRVKVKNIENVPVTGGAVLSCNHVGELDMFFAAFKMKRKVHYMAKEELFRSPIGAWFFNAVGAFPVKRGAGDIGAAKTVLKFLKDGEIVGILPEGTRTKGKDPNSIKVRSGAALFAIKGNVPVIPVAVKGSYRIFSKVEVIYGKPFSIETEPGKKYDNEELAEISKDIMKKVYSLMEES